MPDPFNTPDALSKILPFIQGSRLDPDLVGQFAFSDFHDALTRARNEIARRTLGMDNDDFDDDRRTELTEAELYYAASRLYRQYADRVAVKYKDEPSRTTAEVNTGQTPLLSNEKSQHLLQVIATEARAYADMLLESKSNRYDLQISDHSRSRRHNHGRCLYDDVVDDCHCNGGQQCFPR